MLDCDAFTAGDIEFFLVFAQEQQAGVLKMQTEGREQSQVAVAHDEEAYGRGQVELAAGFQGCGQGFGEDRDVVGQGIVQDVQVTHGGSEELGEGPVPVYDAQDRARGAVAGVVRETAGAFSAAAVDVGGNPFACEFRVAGSVFDGGDEFVAGNAGEAVVAGEEFDIRAADACEPCPEQGLVRSGGRDGSLFYLCGAVMEYEGFHGGHGGREYRGKGFRGEAAALAPAWEWLYATRIG